MRYCYSMLHSSAHCFFPLHYRIQGVRAVFQQFILMQYRNKLLYYLIFGCGFQIVYDTGGVEIY